MQTRKTLLCFSIVAALQSFALAQDTTMFRSDLAHSAQYAQGLPALNGVKWTFHTQGDVISSPAIVGGVVYVGSTDGNLYAVDQDSGTLRWKFATGARITSSPAVLNGLIFFGSYDGYFYAVDVSTGKLKWKFRNGEKRFAAKHLHGSLPLDETVPDPFDVYLSSPSVWKDSVYFGSGDGNVYALDAATGVLKWKFQTGDVVHASPAIVDGKVYIGSWDSFFYALDATNGKEIWKFKTGEDNDAHNQVGIQSSATVFNGIVYFGCRDSKLYALDASTGQQRWMFSTHGSWVVSSPVVHDGKVFFATSDTGTLHALDAQSGAPDFSLKFRWLIFSSPAIAGSTLYVAGLDGILTAVDLNTKKPVWTFQTDASRKYLAGVSKADGTPNYEAVFASTFYDDMVVGVNKLRVVGPMYASPVVSGNVVYIGSSDGNLYALR